VTDRATHRPVPPWVGPLALAGVAGVVLYIASWLVAGWWRQGYDPLRQAISELFELGAPAGSRAVVVTGLVVSALALVAFGPVLHRGLPGTGLLGPALASVSGALTLGVVAFPCSSGCPGFGTTTTDTWHVLMAGGGYLALMLAPLATGWRVREHLGGLARLSFLLGGLALVGLVVRNAGWDLHAGLQQRIFNTLADAWYLVVGVVIARPAPVRSRPWPAPARRGPRR